MTHTHSRGFSLIDLLVSISIITLIMSVSLFSYRTFQNKLAVSAASQEIATAVRQAQTYGLSAKEVSKSGGDFTTGYGVSFDTNVPGAFFIFADKNKDGVFQVGDGCGTSNTECVEQDNLRDGVTLTLLCGTTDAGVTSCPPSSAQSVSFVFNRPDPDATIT